MEWLVGVDHIYPENNPQVKIYDWDKTEDPAMSITQEITPTGDRDAAFNYNVRRTGGNPGNANFLEYHVDVEHVSGFDIASTSLVEADNLKGGTSMGQWLVSAAPVDPESFGGVVGYEMNVLNRQGDMGRKNRRGDYGPEDGCFTAILQLVPENELHVGDHGPEQGHDISFSLCFCHGHGSKDYPMARSHVPICIEPGAIAQGGIGILIAGSEPEVNEPDTPARIIKAYSEFEGGIDFFDACFTSDIAMAIRAEHKIHYGWGSFISGAENELDGLTLGATQLFIKDKNRCLYLDDDNTLVYRWKEEGEWKHQYVAGPNDSL